MADEQTIAPPPETGEPQQAPAPPQDQGGQPPPARKLYDQLNKSQLYTKSFEDFQQQFSKPEAIDKLYQNLNGAKLYTKSKDDFYTQFFQQSKPAPEHEISHTPVQDIRHLNDLANQPIRSTTTALDPTSGGSMTDFNQEDIARNKGFQERYEKSITDLAGTWGTDPKATKQAIQDFPGEPDENKLKTFAGMAQNNPVYYSRLKSANDIRMTIAQSGPDGVNDANVFNHLQTADNYEQLQHNIALQQEIMHKHGLGQAYFEKLKESQAPLINTLDPGLHIQYWNSEDKKLGLSDFQYAGLETEKMFNPGKYQQDVEIIRHNRGLDQGSEPVAIPQGKEGYAYDRGVENVLFALEHQGRDNTGKYISQRTAEIGPQIDGLIQKYKDYIGSTTDPLLQQHFQQEFHNDPLLQEAAKIDEGQKSIEYARTEDQRRFPLNYGDQASRLVKDAMSGTNGWAGVAGKQILLGAGESSDNTMRFIKNTFINLLGSEQAKAENAAANIGHQALSQLAGYEGSAFSQQQSPLIIDKGLVDKIQQTFNDGGLSIEQKNQQATDLILNNEGAIKANPSAGQQNLSGKAVIYSAANTIGQILGIADQSLLMGGLMGDASKAQQMASAVTPMYASTQNQLYEQALARGDEKPLLSSHIDAAIISLASLINPDIKVVKGMVGAETGIGKLIAGVDESTWNKVLSTNKPLMDRMIAGTKATARQLGLANLQYGLIVPTAQYIVHKNILNEDPNLGDALKDGLLQTNISMALPALLHGVWGGVNATKVNPMQKFAIVEAGLHPKENVELIDQLVEKGQITPDRADQIKDVIKHTGLILEHTEAVKSDGTWMNEHEVADLTYQMLRKKVLEGKLKNAPDPQKPAIEAKIHEVNQSIADLHTSDEHKQKSDLNQLLTDNLDRIRDKIQPMESAVKEAIKRNEPETVFKEIYDQASQTTNLEGKEVSARAATEEIYGKALVEKAFELHKQKPEKSAVPPTEEQGTEKPTEGAAPETTGAVEPAASSFLQSRHADTIHDEQGIVSGPNNKELSPKGKRDANDLAKDVEGKGVTKIITSGLERSKETGEKVAEKIGAKVENRPALNTWDIKDFDGLKDDEFKDVQQWFVENPDNTVYQGPLEKYKGKEVAESINEYAHRIIPEMEKIEKESGPETLLINHSNNMMLWDAYLKNGREWNEQAREDYLTSEKPEAATLTNQTNKDAVPIGSPAGEVPRTGTTGENIAPGSEGVGSGQQGEAPAGETGGTGEGQEPPGGASGTKVTPGDEVPGKAISTKNAVADILREENGLPAVEIPSDRSTDKSLNAWRDGTRTPLEIVDQLLSGKDIYDKSITPNDEPIMREYIRGLTNRGIELNKAMESLNEKVKGGDDGAVADQASMKQQLLNHYDEMNRALDAERIGGNVWHKYGEERQLTVNEKGQLINSINRIKTIYGNDMPEEIKKQLSDLQQKHDELVAKNQAIEERVKNLEAENELLKQNQKAKKGAQKTDKDFSSERKDILSDMKDALKNIRKKGYSTVVPGAIELAAIAPHVLKLFKSFGEQGVVKLSEAIDKIHDLTKDVVEGITKDQIKDVITGKYTAAEKLKSEGTALQRKIDKGVGPKLQAPKRKWETDSEWIKNNQEKANLQQKLRNMEHKAYDSQKSMYMRGLDWTNRWGRRVIFFGANAVYTKLSSAAVLGSFIHRPFEQIAGKVNAKLFPSLAEGAPIEGNINMTAEAKFYKEFLNPKKFAQNIWSQAATGETPLSKELGRHSNEKHIPIVDLFAADVHVMIKDPVKRATFEAAVINHLKFYADNSIDGTHPLMLESARQAAYKAAEYEIFQNSPKTTSKINKFFNELEKSGVVDRNMPGSWNKLKGNAEYTAASLYHFFVPVNSVPVNIFERIGLGLMTPKTMAKAWSLNKDIKNGILSLSQQDSDLLMRQLKKGQIGTAYWTLGFILGGSVLGGLYTRYYGDKERKDKPKINAMNIGDTNVPKDVQHTYQFQSSQMGATWRTVHDHYIKDKGASQMEAIAKATAATGGAALEQIPSLEQGVKAVEALQSSAAGEKWIKDLKKRIGIGKATSLLQMMGYGSSDVGGTGRTSRTGGRSR